MRERFTLDPREALSKVQSAALICVAGRDREITPAQAESLRQARAGVELRVFDGLDHAFAAPDGRVDAAFLKVLSDRVSAGMK